VARRILGLDVGSHSVKAVEFRQTLRELEVVKLECLPIVEPAPSLASELRDFLQMHDLSSDHAVLGLSGDRVSTRRLAFPFKDRRRVGAAVPFEVEAQVPFDLEGFFVDWEIVGEAENRTDVVATLAPRSEVALLLQMAREAGLDPRIVEAEGLVMGNLAAFFDLSGTRLLVDLGHRKTTLCLCRDGLALASRTVPLAGRALTEALARERGLGEIEAERVKIEDGIFGGQGVAPSPAGVAVVDRLARELLRTVGSLEPLLADQGAEQLSEVTLVGGTAHLHRIDEYLAERTGLRVSRLGLPAVGTEAGSALLAGGDRLLFAPAIALAVRGSARTRTRMNFRQDELARRVDLRRAARELRSTALFAGAAAVLACGSLATHVVMEGRRAAAVEKETRALYEQVFPGRAAPPNVLAGMQQALTEARDRADTLGVYRGNLSAFDVLTEISARIPEDLDVSFEEFSVDRQIVQIKGHTRSFEAVDRLRAELARYEPFSEITVGDITRDARRGGQTFSVRISLGAGDGQPQEGAS
jgi:general secretion pathway protein L